MDTRTSPARLRIERVRDALTRHRLDALLVPSSDPHLSEYLPPRWQGREWLSGFTGSMATLVVTPTAAALFADSRYWAQAEAELAGSGIELVKIPTAAASHHVEWLTRQVPGRSVRSPSTARCWAWPPPTRCARRWTRPASALRTDIDLIAEAWQPRPALPTAAVYEHLRAARHREPRPTSWRACATRWRSTVPATTSSPPSMTWPG